MKELQEKEKGLHASSTQCKRVVKRTHLWMIGTHQNTHKMKIIAMKMFVNLVEKWIEYGNKKILHTTFQINK